MIAYSPEFEAFWSAYPKRVGKFAAWQRWQKLQPPLPVVLTALQWQRQQPMWLKDGGQFVPHPLTYLNQRRWEDEPFNAPPEINERSLSRMRAIYGDDEPEDE